MTFVKKFAPIILVCAFVVAFFIRLYFPPSFFSTPDFGLSDVDNGNLPTKFLMSAELKKGKFPIWEASIGQGYPLVAEGNGMFYLPNLIIFGVLPLEWAFQTAYVVAFLMACVGTYLLARELTIKPVFAAFGALSFTFSAAMVLRMQHLTVLQAISVLPFVFWSLFIFRRTKSWTSGLMIAFFLSQIFFNFVQLFIYCLVIIVFCFVYDYVKFEHKANYYLKFITVIFFCLLLISAQLLPSSELKRESYRNSESVNGLKILSDFPLKLTDFATYLSPFVHGKASNGTYNYLEWRAHSVFWEKTAYIGIFGIICGIFGIFSIFRRRDNDNMLLVGLLLVLSVLLSLGKYSPLLFLYIFPPLNLFRVPARFMIFSQLFLVLAAAYFLGNYLEKFNKVSKTMILIAIFGLTFFDFYSKWWNYHPISTFENFLKKPEIAEAIDAKSRIYSLGGGDQWNDVFTKFGWDKKEDYYKFFRNSMMPNINIVYGVNSFGGYEVLEPQRHNLLNSFILSHIRFATPEKKSIILDDKALQLLEVSGVDYLVSEKPLDISDYKLVKKVEMSPAYEVLLYKNEAEQPRVKLYADYAVGGIGNYDEKLKQVDLRSTVILENDPGRKFEKCKGEANIRNDDRNRVRLAVSCDKDAILVLSDTYYPGWTATVDSVNVPVIAANVNSRAVIVPAGEHTVDFVYKPKLLSLGILISVGAYIFLACFLLYGKMRLP